MTRTEWLEYWGDWLILDVDRKNRIIELRKRGISYQQIANSLHISKEYVGEISRALGYGGNISQKLSNEQIANTIKQAGFEYLSGYVGSKKDVKVKCLRCGYEFNRQYHRFVDSVHGTGTCYCPNCVAQTKESKRVERINAEQQAIEEKANQKAERERQKAMAQADLISRQMEDRLAIHVCKNCNTEYCIAVTGYNSIKYCSEKCMKRWAMRIKNDRRIRKMKSRDHDNDITLEKLYSRDGGVCYLCGGQCNWDAADNDGNALNDYPSIDHVIPIAKGGKHKWSNIKLAHRGCNTVKRDSIIPLG